MNSQEQMGVFKEMANAGYLNFSNVYRASDSGVYGKMYHLINDHTSVVDSVYPIRPKQSMPICNKPNTEIQTGLTICSTVLFHKTMQSACQVVRKKLRIIHHLGVNEQTRDGTKSKLGTTVIQPM